jgi:hypothetical protein
VNLKGLYLISRHQHGINFEETVHSELERAVPYFQAQAWHSFSGTEENLTQSQPHYNKVFFYMNV